MSLVEISHLKDNSKQKAPEISGAFLVLKLDSIKKKTQHERQRLKAKRHL